MRRTHVGVVAALMAVLCACGPRGHDAVTPEDARSWP
jgi:hypothetical protein